MKFKVNKKITKNIFLIIIISLFTFLFVEVILRLTIEPYTSNNDFCVVSKDFDKYYSFNSAGFRDREFNYFRKTNTFRIMGIGDSFTFGAGVKDVNDTFLKILQSELNKVNDIEYEVMSIAKRGWNTKKELEFLKVNGMKYSPDLIILSYTLNDAEEKPLALVRKDAIKKNLLNRIYYFFHEHTYFVCVLSGHPNIYKLRERLRDYKLSRPLTSEPIDYTNYTFQTYDEKSIEKNKEELDQIIQLAKDNGVDIILVIFPAWLVDDYSDYPYYHLHEFLIDVAKENDIEYIDLIDYFDRLKPGNKLVVSEVDGHPNELAHKVTAYALFKKLNEE